MKEQTHIQSDRWIIKYRPEKLEDFYGLESNYEIIRGLKYQRSYKGILLLGLPGSGKTSLGRYLLKSMRCQSNTTESCGECDACRDFERAYFSAVVDGAWINNDTRVQYVLNRATRPDIDLIIDNLDLSDKSLCRRLIGCMDHYNGGRLILIASDLTFIPKPLQQRCLIITLSYKENPMVQLAKKICTTEAVSIENEESLKDLIGLTNNNPRGLINVLEIIKLKGRKIDQNICWDQDVLANCNPTKDSSKKNGKRRQRR